MLKRLLLLLLVVASTLIIMQPVSAGWGAGWTSGSVIGSGTVTGLKNARKNGATVLATIGAYGTPLVNNAFSGTGNLPGIVYCGNPGTNNNPAPGINPVTLTTNFTGSQFIAGDQINQNGKANFDVHAKPDQNVMNTVIDASAVCPGGNANNPTNWVIIDFVPQQFAALLQGFDGAGNLLTQSVYDCQMPWAVLQSLQFQQQSPYTCTERLDQRVN